MICSWKVISNFYRIQMWLAVFGAVPKFRMMPIFCYIFFCIASFSFCMISVIIWFIVGFGALVWSSRTKYNQNEVCFWWLNPVFHLLIPCKKQPCFVQLSPDYRMVVSISKNSFNNGMYSNIFRLFDFMTPNALRFEPIAFSVILKILGRMMIKYHV